MDNKQALGYMLLACKDGNLDKKLTRKLLKSMMYHFDIKTETEAEKQGFDWYYSLKEQED